MQVDCDPTLVPGQRAGAPPTAGLAPAVSGTARRPAAPAGLVDAARHTIATSRFDPAATADNVAYRVSATAALVDHLRDTQARFPDDRAKVLPLHGAFTADDGTVFVRDRDGRPRVWIPPDPPLRRRLLELAHVHSTGHRGAQALFDFLRVRHYWPGLWHESRAYVAGCLQCGTRNHDHRAPASQSPVVRQPSAPYSVIGMDLYKPPTPGSSYFDHVLVTVCYFTKHVTYTPVRHDWTGNAIIVTLQSQVFAYFGYPRKIVTDNDSRWTSRAFRQWAEAHHIEMAYSVPYHHHRNGLVERQIKTLSEQLSKVRADYSTVQWQHHLPTLQLAHNSVRHSTTEFAPNELLFTFLPATPSDLALPFSTVDYPSPALAILENWATAMGRITKEQEAMIRRSEQRAARRHFVPGLKVYLKNPRRASDKSAPPKTGPYLIIAHGPSRHLYILDVPQDGRGRAIASVQHADLLTEYKGPWPLPAPGRMAVDAPPPPPAEAVPLPPRPSAPLIPRRVRPMTRRRPPPTLSSFSSSDDASSD